MLPERKWSGPRRCGLKQQNSTANWVISKQPEPSEPGCGEKSELRPGNAYVSQPDSEEPWANEIARRVLALYNSLLGITLDFEPLIWIRGRASPNNKILATAATVPTGSEACLIHLPSGKFSSLLAASASTSLLITLK